MQLTSLADSQLNPVSRETKYCILRFRSDCAVSRLLKPLEKANEQRHLQLILNVNLRSKLRRSVHCLYVARLLKYKNSV